MCQWDVDAAVWQTGSRQNSDLRRPDNASDHQNTEKSLTKLEKHGYSINVSARQKSDLKNQEPVQHVQLSLIMLQTKYKINPIYTSQEIYD